MKYFYKTVSSPVEKLMLIARDRALCAILWENESRKISSKFEPLELRKDHPILVETEKQLLEYFNKERREFDLPLDCLGTSFQTKVWAVLANIPYGSTISYGELAAKIGLPKSSRAVGAATGKNPISIIIPCHRVIAKDGSLHGFAGGLEAKEKLLQLEGNFTE